jgi:death-on-curing protein
MTDSSGEPRWLTRFIIEQIHYRQIDEHGGDNELRDASLLESALARAKNSYAYDETKDLCSLAADYAFGISRNHPFVDGNKRSAFLAAYIFLELNGVVNESDEPAVVAMMLGLSKGEITVEEFAVWLRSVSET